MIAIVVPSVWDPLQRFLERGAGLLPVLLAVFVVLVAGLVLAWLLESLVRGVLRWVGFDRLARQRSVAEVMRRTTLGKTRIYQLVGEGSFPRPARLGARRVAWDEREIHLWIAQRLAERDAAA